MARQALRSFLGLLGAIALTARYFMLPSCWALFCWALYSEPVLRLPLLAYLAYILSPLGSRGVGACRWPHLARRFPLWSFYRFYTPDSRVVKTAELDPSRKFVIGIHPHGVAGNSSLLALGTDALGWSSLFPGIRLHQGMLNLILRTPFSREICLLHGWCGVDRPVLLARLAQGPGSAVAIIVGGAAEAVLAEPGSLDLVIRKRLGFVRVALEAGADLVPVLCFGENEQYNRVCVAPGSWLDKLQHATKRLGGFTLPLCYGRGILGLRYGPLPEQVPLVALVGAPLQLPRFTGDLHSPEGRALVQECHARYCRALQALYDQHKERYAPHRKRDLRFVE